MTGALMVADCLRRDPLARGELLTDGVDLAERAVSWVAVIEWPVEDFVAAGELVMTTGVGCDEAMFVQLVDEAAASGAAAILVGTGAGAPFATVPAAACRAAQERGVPVIALPWLVRFADVTRTVIDLLIARRRPGPAGAGGELPAALADVLLQPAAPDGIAAVLERMTSRATLVLDAGLTVIGAGPLGARHRAETGGPPPPPAARAREIRARIAAPDRAQRVEGVPELGFDPALVVAARARDGVAGYVVNDAAGVTDLLDVDRRPLEQAATALAIETLRRRAAVEAQAATVGDFFWEAATAEPDRRAAVIGRARLLGFDPDQPYAVALGTVEGRADAVAERLRRLGRPLGARVAARDGQVLVAAPQPPETLARMLERAVVSAAHWGVAAAGHPLAELATGLADATRARAVGSVLFPDARVHAAAALGPFLMLAGLAADPQARADAERTLGPLLAYDARTRRGLLHTLAVYFEEQGNGTAAARRLHLNRHSLRYRLRKIEELTGRSLERPEDRFLLELSQRVLRLSPPA